MSQKILVSKAFFVVDSPQPSSVATLSENSQNCVDNISTEAKSSEISTSDAITDGLDSSSPSYSMTLLNHEFRKRKPQLPLVPYSSGSNSDEADSLEMTDQNPSNIQQVANNLSPAAFKASPIVESDKASISVKHFETNGNVIHPERMDEVISMQEVIEVRRPRLLSSMMGHEKANITFESTENSSDTVKDVRRRADEKRRRMLETHGCQVALERKTKKQTLIQTDFIVESRPTPKLRIQTSVPVSSNQFLPPPPTNSPENNPPKLSRKVNLYKPLAAETFPKPISTPTMDFGCCPDIPWPSRSRNFRSTININMADILPGSVFDSHCHLDFCSKKLSKEGNRDIVTLETMLAIDGEGMKVYDSEERSGKFGGCIANFCDPSSWNMRYVSEAVRQAETEKGVYISLGCHPHFANRLNSDWRMQMEHLVVGKERLGKLVALGEMGLDYSGKNNVDRELQKKVFKAQLEIALKYAMPVVLHIREAEEDGYQVLSEVGVPPDYPLHRHCFNGDLDAAKRWLYTYPGSMIGLTGLVTFPDASHIHEVAKWISLDRLLLETDAPYFLPKGIDRSEYSMYFSLPGHVIYTAAEIASLRGDNIANILAANARNVLKIYGVGKEGIVKSSPVSVPSNSGRWKNDNRTRDNDHNRNGDTNNRVGHPSSKISLPFLQRARKSPDQTKKKIEDRQQKNNSSHNSSVVNFVSEDRVLDESGSFLGGSTNTSNSSNKSQSIQSSKAWFTN